MEEPWDGDSVSKLGPVLELQCRARELLGDDVPVHDEEPAKVVVVDLSLCMCVHPQDLKRKWPRLLII